MELKDIKVEAIDEESRLILKKVRTSDKEFYNRELAISNSIYTCEKNRIQYSKPIMNSNFQTCHLRWDKREKEWDFLGLKNAKEHAESNNRIFVPYKQRNTSKINKITWKEAKEDVCEFVDNYKLNNIPIPIPVNANLKEYKENKKQILSTLNAKQNLIPVFSSKHDIKQFPYLIKNEITNSRLIGIKCYEFSSIIEQNNLAILKMISSKVKLGTNIPLIICFDYPRIMTRQSYVAGSFAYNCFSGDVFSERAYFIKNMNRKSINDMKSKKPEDYYLYDPKQKKFNKSDTQESWYGMELTRKSMESISVNEGLTGYQTIKWINHALQQRDLDMINNILQFKENLIDTIKDYSGWAVFWQKVASQSSSQKPLSNF